MKFWQVDAFTKAAFGGNPAAIFVVEDKLDTSFMQKIAAEMNLAETAFVTLHPKRSIRWFTPTKEVKLCGHATLAAAHVLWQEGIEVESRLTFESQSGTFPVLREEEGLTLSFPLQQAHFDADLKEEIEELLECSVQLAGSNGEDCLVVLENQTAVHSFVPNFSKIAQLQERGILITAVSDDPGYLSRRQTRSFTAGMKGAKPPFLKKNGRLSAFLRTLLVLDPTFLTIVQNNTFFDMAVRDTVIRSYGALSDL